MALNILSVLCYLIASVSFVLSLIYFYAQYKFSYWVSRGVPCLDLSFPFGNVKGLGKTTHLTHKSQAIYEQFKSSHKVAGFYFTVVPKLLILDLDLVKSILVKDFNYFPHRGLYYNEKGDPLSAHLFNLEKSKWKIIRPKVSPAFTSGKLKSMFHLMVRMTKDLHSILDRHVGDESAINIRELCMQMTGDIISLCAFGLESNCLVSEDSEFIRVAKSTFDFTAPMRQLSMFVQNTFINFSRKVNLRVISEDAEKYFMNAIKSSIHLRDTNKLKQKDVMDILLQLHRQGTVEEEGGEIKDVGKISFQEMAATAFVFFFAGFETTSTTIMFLLFEVAKKQDIQDRVRSEIRQMLDKYDGQLTYEGIHELEYTGRVIKETLRLYPVAFLLFRNAVKDYKIPDMDLTIEKGTDILISTYAIHRDPDIYPNPDDFDPDRFLPENIQTRHPFSYMPFGDGPRNCIGMRFGLLEVRVAVCKMLLNYKFTVNAKTPQPARFDEANLLMSIKGDIWLNVSHV